MSDAFEIIKQAEQRAEDILSAAKEEAASLRRESAFAVKKLEDDFRISMSKIQEELLRTERDEIEKRSVSSDEKVNKLKKEIRIDFLSFKKELALSLAGKVIGS